MCPHNEKPASPVKRKFSKESQDPDSPQKRKKQIHQSLELKKGIMEAKNMWCISQEEQLSVGVGCAWVEAGDYRSAAARRGGQVGSSTTCNMLTRLSFVFVQLLLLPHGTTINASGDVFEHAPTHGGSGLAMTQPILTPFCNLTTAASSNQHQMSWLIGRPRGTSTSSTETTKTRIIDSFFSGQVGSSTTCNMLTRLSFVFVQYVSNARTVNMTRLAAFAAACEQYLSVSKKQRRAICTLLRSRKTLGEYATTVRQMYQDPDGRDFFESFRMSRARYGPGDLGRA
ncbi:hypothetical protein ISCGN_000041 [Ixodes scapularis]